MCVFKGFNAHSIHRELCKADLPPLPPPKKNLFQINTNFLFPGHKYIHQLLRVFSSSYPFDVHLDIWKVCLAGEGAKKERSSVIVRWDFVPCSVCQTAEKLSHSSSYVHCWTTAQWQWTAQQPPEWWENHLTLICLTNQGLQAFELQLWLWPISLRCFLFISLFLTFPRWGFVIYHKPVAVGWRDKSLRR